eukprot:COSAG01_NODE_18398_length_1078_cov_1.605720_2_plen_80_part_01
MTEFTSEDACETLVAEFLALRPTHMDAQNFLEKAVLSQGVQRTDLLVTPRPRPRRNLLRGNCIMTNTGALLLLRFKSTCA